MLKDYQRMLSYIKQTPTFQIKIWSNLNYLWCIYIIANYICYLNQLDGKKDKLFYLVVELVKEMIDLYVFSHFFLLVYVVRWTLNFFFLKKNRLMFFMNFPPDTSCIYSLWSLTVFLTTYCNSRWKFEINYLILYA